ncbi:putative nuclease HARBI1 [Carcharodon carcharias]|uniref:putative nuclease HARBI1 n=1 Tax=Carcharodon carcharias TaxID=13397 RepID=UPI001B7E757F|nr:putative nuclease HARBI1 [Carcharodon carcharias]
MTYLKMAKSPCLKRLRLSRATITELCALTQDDLHPWGNIGHGVPVALRVTAAVNFYAASSFQGSTGDVCSISQAATHYYIKDVKNALQKRTGEFIRFWMDEDNQVGWAMGFIAISIFPCVQSVIDCTHAAIKAPSKLPAPFINRKGFYSLSVKLIYDHKKQILQVCARYPGSNHDAYVFQHSQMPQSFMPRPHIRELIKGDSGYPFHTWVMVLVRNPVRQKRVNAIQGTTRNIIEPIISLLKMRFCCLDLGVHSSTTQ